jgi:hypothetical protein
MYLEGLSTSHRELLIILNYKIAKKTFSSAQQNNSTSNETTTLRTICIGISDTEPCLMNAKNDGCEFGFTKDHRGTCRKIVLN